MLNQPTIDKLITMRLRGMAEAFRQQQESADTQRLSFEERLGLLIDRQWNWRENRALERRLRNGRLKVRPVLRTSTTERSRGLDRQLVRSLTQESVWVREHQNLFLRRSNRRRENVAGPRIRAQGVPRRVHCVVP